MSSTATNRAYYEAASAGRDDYWRYMAAPRQRVARIVSLLRRAGARSIVDLGCGNGRLLGEVVRAIPGAELAGVDLSARQIEENRARAPHVTWIAADLQQPLAERGTYAAAVASEVIEHLDDPALLLANARALVAPNGHLIVTTQSGPIRETERRVGHVRHFSAAEMTALLERNGWQPLDVWNEGFPFHDLSKWWANRNADASMARFGGAEGYGRRERAVALALRVAFQLNSRRRGAQLYALARRAA